MSQFEFKLPDIGEGVTEGEIVEWLVAEGDVVAEDDPMVEVMTDKATVTIGAPRAGTIGELRFDPGAVAKVGQVIVVIRTEGGAAAAPAARAKTDDGPAATAVGDIREGLPGSSYFKSASPAAGSNGSNGVAVPVAALQDGGGAEFFADKPLATPATRKLARDLDVDLRRVPPTGPGGRVTKDDVRSFRMRSAVTQPAPAGGAPAAPRMPISPAGPGEREHRRPLVGIRRKIAQRMQHTKNTAAHFTFVEECDVGRLIEMRARLKPVAAEQGVSLSFLPFIAKAVCAALRKHPTLNCALDETTNELVYRDYVHLGIAAATDQGLVVPVIRDADQRSVLDIAREIARLGDGAREGRLAPQELSGSTFTITSLGKQGGLFATPILNHPEVGILGVHQMKQKPVVRDGQIVVGDVMLLSLSFDHRIVDGHVGAAFAYDIIAYLEDPGRLFIEMV